MSVTTPGSTPDSASGAWRYRPELDGLRTLAVTAVIFFHAGVGAVSGGFVGVDLFFVLSGFLVTNILMLDVDAGGRIRLGRFYARRVRRLLPAAVFAILAISAVFLLVASSPVRLPLVRHAQAALVYLVNWQFISESADYFATDVQQSPFMHFWSLSIEEQYYIVFPLLLVVVLRLFGRRRWALVGVPAVLLVLSVGAQLYWGAIDQTRAYYGTDARAFQLLAGAVAALVLRSGAARPAMPAPGQRRWLPGVVAVVALVAFVLLASGAVPLSTSWRTLLVTPVALALILGLYAHPTSIAARGFALPWLVYLGKISYGTYLWHWPVIVVMRQFVTAPALVVAIVAGVVANALAALSYVLLETPIRRSKVLDRVPWPSVATGITVSLLVAAFVVGPVLGSSRAPVVAVAKPATNAAALSIPGLDRPVPKFDLQKIATNSGPRVPGCTPDDLRACLLVAGDGPHVVLIGDSQARYMVPAFERLAKEKGFKLSADIIPSCPWQKGLFNPTKQSTVEESCVKRRDGFFETTLPAMKPDLVVLASLARSDESWQGVLVDETGRSGDLHEMQLRTTLDTMAVMREIGTRVVIIHSIMGTGGWDRQGPDPLDCLARASVQRDCVVLAPPDRPIVDSYYDYAATVEPNVATIDINPLVCPDLPICRPILHGRPVWRDHNHLTVSVVTSVREQIWEQLRKASPGLF